MDANTINYWLIKFVQEVANSQRKVYPARNPCGIIHGLPKNLQQTEGSQALTPLDASDKR